MSSKQLVLQVVSYFGGDLRWILPSLVVVALVGSGEAGSFYRS
jgi:hypothetical protein